MMNPRYKCIKNSDYSSIFYYEPQQQTWDKSRQLCSQKFYGSYYADLVELSDYKIELATNMMKSIENLLEDTTGLYNCSRTNFHLLRFMLTITQNFNLFLI